MKLFRMFLVSLALSLIFAGAALAKADVTELYAEALMTGDVESLDKLLAPNYWHVSANGHIQDKEHFLASLKERKLVKNLILVVESVCKELIEELRTYALSIKTGMAMGCRDVNACNVNIVCLAIFKHTGSD